MINQVVNINHKKYATGLFWQPVGVGITAHNYARKLSKASNNKYNLYAEYRNSIGLCDVRHGNRAGMSVLAVEIKESLSEYTSFCCVFNINGKFYLIAVRNEIIIKDELISDIDLAKHAIKDLLKIPDWGLIIAPDGFEISKAHEKNITEIVRGIGGIKLRNINILKSGIPSIIFVILFVALAMYLIKSPIGQLFAPNNIQNQSPELAEEYKRQLEEKNKELDAQFEIKKVEPIVLPYDYLPDVSARSELCFKAIGFVMQPIAGWNQTYAKCDENYVTASFSRDFGSLNDFYTIGTNLMPGAIVQELSENEIIVRAKLPTLPVSSSLEEKDADTVMRDIKTIFQTLNTQVDINVVVDTVSNGVDTKDINVVEIAASSKLIPKEFIKIFQDFNGVYMTSAVWNMKTRIWNYEVIIYTK
ncbi:MAG: type 4b pilus protein PilO2 [Alphaproteobacteria bacterium]|nr:type 4b pilus protein PilO2 [Alphaproteobacteria bacterium]